MTQIVEETPDEKGVPEVVGVENPTISSGDEPRKKRIVILGSGWGAAALLQSLDRNAYEVILVSPQNFFLFTPLLPSVTVGTVEARSVVESIRHILKRIGGKYLQGRATAVDFENRLVKVECAVKHEKEKGDGTVDHSSPFYVEYDKLILAVGCISNTYGVPGTDKAHLLKSVEDAREIRNHVYKNLELASNPTISPKLRKKLLTFIICGGGPTGTELAAELSDLLSEEVPKFVRSTHTSPFNTLSDIPVFPHNTRSIFLFDLALFLIGQIILVRSSA